MSKYDEFPIDNVHLISIQDRISKVNLSQMARPLSGASKFIDFWESLPDVLKVSDLKKLVRSIIEARGKGKPVLVMMGAHVIKTGLNPILIDLMHTGWIQGLAMNGAGAIHDVELCYFGTTSEDVDATLQTGEFGMVRETGDIINDAIKHGANQKQGFGESIGERIFRDQPLNFETSLLGQAYQLNIPVTVHVALGTDIIHQQPGADGSAIGDCSLRDFRIFTSKVASLHDGGVVLLFGSAVIMPEVFLKALTVARNVNGPVDHFVTANFDMNQHYRPLKNVVQRPTIGSGTGYTFVGHHEIMIPLLAAAMKASI